MFNKGMLLNLGYQEAVNSTHTDCLVLHDVDLVPVNSRNPYTCGTYPRHLPGHIHDQKTDTS